MRILISTFIAVSLAICCCAFAEQTPPPAESDNAEYTITPAVDEGVYPGDTSGHRYVGERIEYKIGTRSIFNMAREWLYYINKPCFDAGKRTADIASEKATSGKRP